MFGRTHKIGLDANQPIDNTRGVVADRLADPEIIASTGAAWVRLNFVLGPWSGPEDTTRHHRGRTWAETYQTIIDQYIEREMNVYGLIGHESVKSSVGLPEFFRDHRDQTSNTAQADRWIADYVNNFEKIVKLFQRQVKIFESFNEPDDWHGQKRAWIHPTWFAVMLTEIYRRIKIELGLEEIKLISGPLQGLEKSKNEATKYLRETYQYGKQRLGWGRDVAYPFDGVGYHLYIKEAFSRNWPVQASEVEQTYRRYIDGILQEIRQAEGEPADTGKKLYISEIGWPSNRDTLEEKDFQARNLTLALDLLVKDPAVALGIWFCTEDFEPGEKFYGLYQMGQATAQGRKPAYYAFKAFCHGLLVREPEPTLERRPGLESVSRASTSVPGQARPSVAATSTRPAQPTSAQPAVFGGPVATGRKTIRQELADIKDQLAWLQSQLEQLPSQPSTPTAATMQSISQELALLRHQNSQLQDQLGGVEGQLQRLSSQQAWLQSQVQQLQAQPPVVPGPPVEISPVVPTPPPPGAIDRLAPSIPIQDITRQLRQHPTRRFQSRSLDQIQRVIIHHTAIPSTIGAERIAAYGVDKKGWPGIRYHYFITGSGQIQQTNELTTLATHAGPYSAESIGLGFAGDFSRVMPTPAQIDAGARLIAWLLQRFNLSIQAVFGYKELINTQSPGLQWDGGLRWGDQLKEKILTYLST